MLPNTHPAKYPYSIFRRAQESVRNDVVSGLGIRLQVFQNELIRQITGHNEIDLTLPGKRNVLISASLPTRIQRLTS